MNRNVLNWLTEQAPQARHALVLTHNINFLFVQTILLPKLRAAGNPRVTIFADAGCATAAWRQDRALLDGLGIRYRVVLVDMGPYRRFHPKALLLADRERAALAIGSGNLTFGGMSSNREGWTFAVSEGEGGHRIAAFRDYLSDLLERVPLAEPLRDAFDAIFDPDNAWVENLAAPAGLATAPASPHILDQLAAVAGEVRAVTVLAPYYDDRGEALAEIAKRFAAPVTALLQPGRAGLWTGAATALPANVILKSVQNPGERPAFIHAKVLALHRDDDVLLAVGSANCSVAALLSDADRGNAELMAFEAVSHEVAETFLGELTVTDQAPDLPQERPSEDWPDEERPALRILAARAEGGELEIAFKADQRVRDLVVVSDGEWPVRQLDMEQGVARLAMPVRPRTVSLRATMADGSCLISPESWVDDEASLAAPATLRRVFRKLTEAQEPGADPAHRYQAILEAFHEYLRDPEAARRGIRRGDKDGDGPSPYDPASVFDDSFGTGGLAAVRGLAGGADVPSSPLAIIEALFAVGMGVGVAQTPPPEDGGESGEPPDSDVEDASLIRRNRPSPDAKAAAAVRRAVGRVEQALLDPAFVKARAPELLEADIALAALLLVMGLTERHLEESIYRETTRRLWGVLFFGKGSVGGAIPDRHAALCDDAARADFVTAFASSRLTAALALWSVTEWAVGDADALWFQLSAARLHARCPWIFAAADPDRLIDGLQTMSSTFLPPNEQAVVVDAWRRVVRAGTALEVLQKGLKQGSRNAFSGAVRSPWLDPSELVWTACGLALPVDRTQRDASRNISVRLLGAETQTRFRTSYVFAVRDLITANVLDLPTGAEAEILRLLGGFAAVGAEAFALR